MTALRDLVRQQSRARVNTLPTVSAFANAFDPEPVEHRSLAAILADIKGPRWQDEVDGVRRVLNRGNRKAYDDAKRRLPAFCMSARVRTRAKEVDDRLEAHSGILQADFDDKTNPQLADLEEVKELLQDDPHVAFGFVSPSGKGLKCGVRIDGSRHAESFEAATRHFAERYGLEMDPSTKDPMRLCFVSHDPELWINESAVPIPIPVKAVSKANGVWHPPLDTTAEDLREMLSCIPPRPDYDTWLRIASAVWSVLPLVEGTHLLIEWSPEEHAGEYAKKWAHRLTEVHVGTLAWYASQHGFDARAAARRKRWAGRIRFAAESRSSNEAVDPPEEFAIEIPEEQVWKSIEEEQLGDAELFSAAGRGLYCYDHLASTWRSYMSGLWARDDKHQVRIIYANQLRQIYRDLIQSIEQNILDVPPPEGAKDVRFIRIKTIRKRIRQLGTRAWAFAGLDLAQSLEGFAREATEFDRAPHLLAVRNGVIDFEAGEFREGRQSDMLTVRAPVSYDERATCPKFDEFLRFFMDGDQEVIDFLWRAIGYSLTGWVDKDVLFFCYGKGANGKTTFDRVLRMLLGPLCTMLPIDTLIEKRADANLDYKKAMLEGCRVCVTEELPDGRALAEGTVKALIGGEPIVARRPYEKPYEFEPTHKVWMVGNHKPTIKGTDLGIWRRILLIPFTVTIPESERRQRHEVLADFRGELSGILNLALAGFEETRNLGGLKPPKTVTDATAEYRQDEDQLAQFLDERTRRDLAAQTRATEVLGAYMAWCKDNHEVELFGSSKKLVGALRDRGFRVLKDHQRMAIIAGLRIESPEMADVRLPYSDS